MIKVVRAERENNLLDHLNEFPVEVLRVVLQVDQPIVQCIEECEELLPNAEHQIEPNRWDYESPEDE